MGIETYTVAILRDSNDPTYQENLKKPKYCNKNGLAIPAKFLKTK